MTENTPAALENTPAALENTPAALENTPAAPEDLKTYYVIELVDAITSISAINKFMTIHPGFFKSNINKKIVHFNEGQVYFVYTEPLYFRDTIHHVNGFITTDLQNNLFSMKVNINKTNRSKECYIKQIENYVNYQTKYGNNVELNYYKILSETIIKHCYYNEAIEQWTKDAILVQNEFFSPHKKYLFSIINDKTKNNGVGNTANSWNNLILYGKAGTGKSSCIYRISMLLKLSIISVDLSLYFNKKKELYALFHSQEFSLPNTTTKESAIPNAIIVLEEFDYAIDKLLDIENIFKYKDLIKREYLTMKNKEIKSRTTVLLDEYSIKTTSRKNEQLAPLQGILQEDTPDDYDTFVERELLNDGITNKGIFDRASQTVLKKRDFDNELSGINAELNTIIKNMDEDNKSNILRLSDLLELFQGPVPVKNRIIIATTNNFDKIKTALPMLFRAGRLSPIQFDYLDWESLNELCYYYFQSHLTCDPMPITISTSQIIEVAIKNILTKKTFAEFQKELLDLML
jgi:hypothetical protein